MRIIAFLAALAGATTLAANATVVVIQLALQQFQNVLPLAYLVATYGQLVFIVLLTVFLFAFALRRRAS